MWQYVLPVKSLFYHSNNSVKTEQWLPVLTKMTNSVHNLQSMAQKIKILFYQKILDLLEVNSDMHLICVPNLMEIRLGHFKQSEWA